MHRHHEDMFNGIELGAQQRSYQYSIDSVARNQASAAKNAVVHQRDEKKADGTTAKVDVTATDQAKEAIKDRKITKDEKTAFDKTPAVKEVVKDEQARLKDAVRKAEGASEHLRDRDGKLQLDKKGKAQPSLSGARDPKTADEKRVIELSKDKDKKGLDAIDGAIKSMTEAGSTSGVEALTAQRAARLAEEQKVVAVIEDKESLIGTLEAEKLEIGASAPAGAADDYQATRVAAQGLIDKFNENDGQWHQGAGLFEGDHWDDGKVDFDKLEKMFTEHPERLEEFARVQGKNDTDGGKSPEDMQAHIAKIALEDPAKAAKIANRYDAAVQLTELMGAHLDVVAEAKGGNEAIEQIDAEIKILEDSIDYDKKALSTETLATIDANNKPVDGVIPNVTPDGAEPATNEPVVDPTTGKPVDPTTEQPVDPSSGQPVDPTTEQPVDPSTGQPVDPAAGPAPVDYSRPEARLEVIAKAQDANLLPKENVSYHENGTALYTVQPGDSYWRIADMSDGKPSNEFDGAHFMTTLDVNSRLYGRDPQQGLIHPNEQVVLPGRSIDELIALLGLNTPAPAEEDVAA